MKRFAVLATSAVLAACAGSPVESPSSVPPSPVAIAPAAPPPASGIELGGFDRNVRPQDDLFRHVNGTWLAKTDIPADRSTWGMFAMLDEASREQVHRIAEESAADANAAPGSDSRRVGDFYRSFMDRERLDQLGLKPLVDDLARAERVRTVRDLFAFSGRAIRAGGNAPLNYFVTQDKRDTTQYIGYVSQAGLTMPDRDYYLGDAEQMKSARAAHLAYLEKLLALAGEKDARGVARRVAALETRLAKAQWSRVQNRDPVATYTKVDAAAAAKLAPGLPWDAYFTALGAPGDSFVVTQASYVRELGRIVKSVPMTQWREYLRVQTLDGAAPYLGEPWESLHFDFHQRTLLGVKQAPERWKRAIDTMDPLIGELVGRVYVERHFPPESKRRVRELVDNLLRTFSAKLDGLEWMTPETRAQAKAKLAKFTVKVGYPDVWRSYEGLEVSPTDLLGNVRRASAFETQRQIDRLGGPIDRTEWLMTPQTVNAYYYPPANEIVFPAAILQPPFFDAKVDDAANYGGIGAVIGHEISHGFDDSGRQYDGDGNLRDWWSMADAAGFKKRAGQLVQQYSGYQVLDGRVNGELTLGENIGDLSGLAVAFDAWKLSLDGRESPVIDGLTGAQRFFTGWAQVWRAKVRDEAARSRLTVDPHSPPEFRVNGVVTNMTEFHEAFGLVPGDRLYRAPEDRVKIW